MVAGSIDVVGYVVGEEQTMVEEKATHMQSMGSRKRTRGGQVGSEHR